MGDTENNIEMLEQKISEFQKQIAIKRELLKTELESEDDERVELIQDEIKILKEKVLLNQGELRKMYLKKGNVTLNEQGKDKLKPEILRQTGG